MGSLVSGILNTGTIMGVFKYDVYFYSIKCCCGPSRVSYYARRVHLWRLVFLELLKQKNHAEAIGSPRWGFNIEGNLMSSAFASIAHAYVKTMPTFFSLYDGALGLQV